MRRGEIAVRAALSMLGRRYRYGAVPGDTDEFDCSSFVQWAWRHAGIALPREAAEQFRRLPRVDPAGLVPGDLLFFNRNGRPETYRFRGVDHVSMYIGDGRIVEAGTASSGVHVVSLVSKGRPVGAARPR
jgi:peptidoglycan DL-endopeptidase CwlO